MFKKKKEIKRSKINIQWHLLEQCNLHCKHCYQDEKMLLNPVKDYMYVLNKIDEYVKDKDSDVQINLTGGEPLLFSNLFDLIDEIIKRGYLWSLLTNGTLMTPEIVNELKKRNPHFIQVSLEGNKEINDSCRGDGTYEQILKAIDLLTAAKIKVNVSFTVTSNNFESFPLLSKELKKHKIHWLWCDRYVGNDDQCICTEDYKKFLGILKKELKKPHVVGIRSLQFLAGGEGYYCAAGRNLLVILPDGTLLPCRRLPLKLGNIYTDGSIEDILSSSSVWEEVSKPISDISCLQCKHYPRCFGGAKCVTYAQTGKLNIKDVNCYL